MQTNSTSAPTSSPDDFVTKQSVGLAGSRSEPGEAESESAQDRAGLTFDLAFQHGGATRANVMNAFEGAITALSGNIDREEQLRGIAKAAALSAARSHGNIIEAGRTLLGSIDELGERYSLDIRRSKDQVMLGLAEGACQIGPIVYGRFLDIACEYRDNADDWIAKNKRRVTALAPLALPVIVPFEAELTLSTKPFKEPERLAEPVLEGAEPQPKSVAPEEPSLAEAPPVEWSRPKGKGFFRRLSDVMGNLFGRS